MPYFQGNPYGPMTRKFVKSFPPGPGIGPWMALPKFGPGNDLLSFLSHFSVLTSHFAVFAWGVECHFWGVAKGSSISWIAKFKEDDQTSECKLSNGRSRSYREIKLLLSAGK